MGVMPILPTISIDPPDLTNSLTLILQTKSATPSPQHGHSNVGGEALNRLGKIALPHPASSWTCTGSIRTYLKSFLPADALIRCSSIFGPRPDQLLASSGVHSATITSLAPHAEREAMPHPSMSF